MHSDSEQYSPGAEDLSVSPPSSGDPVVLYQPPTTWSLLRGAAINLVLPFINGMMLGFGELFAHEAAFRLGWGGTKVFPLSRRRAHPIGPGIEILKLSLQELQQPQPTMLPSRGATLVFSGATSRIPARSFVFPGAGRGFGTLRQAGPSPWPSRRRRLVVGSSAPSATRQLSLWGWSPSLPGWPSSVPGWAWATGSPKSKPAPEAELIPPIQPVAVEPTTTPLQAIPSTEIDTTLLSEALTAEDILNLPIEPGYLRALGLDYGWGPTSVMQWTIEHVHVYTGLGWAATIVTTAFLLRVMMLYPQYRSLKFGVSMQRMKEDPRAEAALKLGQEAAADRNMEKQMQSRLVYKTLQKEYGFSGWGMMWSIGQIPFGYGLFRIINGMAGIPVPSFESAGWLWFPDLAAKDPYFILPVVGTSLMILSVTVRNPPSISPTQLT
ncbi:hypothetical protein CDD80_535 [Ophiocordyceps camponoti-rufipedis]|uniref:Mitochondrial import protein 1 n=1 Tax=Ophiocordyceps camponoti-rufipedis TaxID=2004952 RepID=A0A2C5ZCB4_9HYPO|nr:hypothetical protein CDD80_535 [Ophiocordyceps camponoti-rufipedis]